MQLFNTTSARQNYRWLKIACCFCCCCCCSYCCKGMRESKGFVGVLEYLESSRKCSFKCGDSPVENGKAPSSRPFWLHKMTPDIQQKLLELHTQADLPEPRSLALPPPPDLVCELNDIKAALMSFPTATAPGPSGLRAAHLRECTTSSSETADRLLNALTLLANRALNGSLPRSVLLTSFFQRVCSLSPRRGKKYV